MSKETNFGYIIGWHNLDKVSRAVFNEYHIDVFGIALAGQDTEFTYLLKTEHKLTASKVLEIKAFIKGTLSQLGSALYSERS